MLSSKGKKWLLIIAGVSLFLLISAQSLVHLIIEPSIETFVKELIELRSDSHYKVESLEVAWNLADRTLSINELEIKHVADQAAKEPYEHENIFNFKFPHIELRHVFIREYLATRRLHTSRLYIKNPEITCLHEQELVSGGEREKRRLYDLISSQLREIQIDEFELTGGKLSYNDQKNFKRNSFVADQLHFFATDVRMDSSSGDDFLTWFTVGEADLEINIDKYIHITEDSTYVFKAGKFGLSSSKNEIFIENLHLEPNLRHLNPNQKNLFEIKVPRLLIQGIRPREAAIHRDVKLGAVRLISPTIVQIGAIKTDSVREGLPGAAEIYESLNPYIRSLNIDGLSIERGSFYKIKEKANPEKQVAIKGIGLYMQDIALDSSSTINGSDQQFLLSKELELKVDTFKILLNENTYSLAGINSRISSIDKRISGSMIQLHPLPGTRERLSLTQQDIIDLEVPLLEIEGVDLDQLWFRQVLDVSQIRIQQPHVGLTNFPQLEQEKIDEITQKDFNQLIRDYLNILSVRKLDIIGGSFDFKAGKDVLGDGFNASNLGVSIRNFRLSPQTQKEEAKPFYADDIRISMEVDDYSLTLPDSSYTIQVKHLGIATADSSIVADSIYISPLGKKGEKKDLVGDIFIPHSYFKGLDIYKSYFQQDIVLDSVYFSGAKIHIEDNRLSPSHASDASLLDKVDWYNQISQSIRSLSVHRLSLEKGSLEIEQSTSGKSYVLPKLSLDVYNFNLDSSATHKDALFYAENINLGTQNFLHNLSDSIHQLRVKSVRLSTRQGNIQACGISILPRNNTAESLGKKFQIRVPEVELDKIDLLKLFESREAEMATIRIDSPIIELEHYPDIDKSEIDSLAKTNFYDFISDELNTLIVGQLLLNEGKLKVNDYQGKTNEFNAENLNLLVRNFQLDSTSADRSHKVFYAQNIELSARVEDYFFMLPDSTYALRIGNVAISTSDSSVTAKNIRLLPQWNNRKIQTARQAWEIDLPELTMAGINPKEWYFHSKLELGSLLFKNPVIRQVILQSEESREPKDLYEILHSYIDYLKIKNLEVQKAIFLQERPEEDDTYLHTYKGVDLKARNFTLDSLGVIRKDRLFYSDDLRIRLDRHSFPFKDSMYTFTFKTLRFSTQDKYAVFDSAKIYPNFETVDFVMKNGYAENSLDVQTHEINFQNLDVFRLVEKGKLWVENMEIQGLDFRIYKDQRFRLQPGRRPPFPQEMIRDIPIPLKIDEVSIIGGAVNFQVRTSFRRQPGSVYLTDINSSIRYISNDEDYLKANPFLTTTFESSATLMNSGKLTAKFLFLLNDSLNSYNFTGSVGLWDMTELNPILIPVGRIRVKQGEIKKAEFEVFGDKYESNGSMMMRYNDLKVSVLDEKGGEQEALKRRPLISALANTLVVKQDNPNRRFLRYGKIKYVVDPEKGFVNHWVQAVLSGVKSSVGMEEVEKKDKKGGLNFLKKKKAIP